MKVLISVALLLASNLAMASDKFEAQKIVDRYNSSIKITNCIFNGDPRYTFNMCFYTGSYSGYITFNDGNIRGLHCIRNSNDAVLNAFDNSGNRQPKELCN